MTRLLTKLRNNLRPAVMLAACVFPPASIAGVATTAVAPVSTATVAAASCEFRLEDIHIGEGDARLAGTLVSPLRSAPAPAVVVVSGSGPNGRDGRIRGFAAYRVIAEHLACTGTATLLLDRRGVGGSAGNWKHERIEDRSRDTLVALQWLRRQRGIDPARVGILGHSQGGWVAEQAAADSADVAFVVLMAGPGETVREQVLTDERNELLRNGATREEAAHRVRTVDRWLGLMDAIAPLCRGLGLHPLCYTVEYDPTRALGNIHVPVLALFGGLDTMVPPERNLPRIEDGLRRAGNDRLSVHVFDGANHQFWAAKTGARAEYAKLQPAYVPGFLDAISDWIATVPGRTR